MNVPGFIEKKVLGSGTYGKVYKAIRQSDNKPYAVKVVNLSTLDQREIEDSVNEIRIIASFESPFILGFYEAFCDKNRLCIVTEYAKLGDLQNFFRKRKLRNSPLPEESIWRFFLQILEGLRVLHSSGVVHRDLKSANVMLSAPDLLKIGDLGIATVLHARQLARTQIGTPLYLAPEVWKRCPYDQKCDMWSLGVLLYEMMTFSYPFNGRNTDELARRVCAGVYPVPSKYSLELTSILRKLLSVSPRERPSVDELLQMQCVKDHMELLNQFPIEESQSARLLETIKVPRNVRDVHFPSALYGKKKPVAKPMGQRLHLKGVSLSQDPKRNLSALSTPDLMQVAVQDLWSPNKQRGMAVSDPMQQNQRQRRLSDKPLEDLPPAPSADSAGEVIEKIQKRRMYPTRKINFIVPARPNEMIIDHNVQFKPVFAQKKNENVCNNNNYAVDPRWRQIPLAAQLPQPQPQPQAVQPVRQSYEPLAAPFALGDGQAPWDVPRKHPVVAINPRFRRIAMR